MNYQGRVNGIDAQATPGLKPRCQAYIVNDRSQIQVSTSHYNLQSALECASKKGVEVEVTYDDSTPENILARVRLLDR